METSHGTRDLTGAFVTLRQDFECFGSSLATIVSGSIERR